MKSSRLGQSTSDADITNVDAHGVWVFVKGREYSLPYEHYPWFKQARLAEILNARLLHGFHLHWPDVDVDLSLESLDKPEAFPLGPRVKPAKPLPRRLWRTTVLGDSDMDMTLLVAAMAVVAGGAAAEKRLEPPDSLPPAPKGPVWKLVWHDEFDGTEVDGSKWEVMNCRRRAGWWSPEAVSLDGKGHLVIRTFKKAGKYYDGCVRTRGKFERAFGYFVARIRLQRSAGHWSAFWMWGPGVTRIGNGGMDGTEIDIMEKPWIDDRVQHTLHWDGYGREHRSAGHVSRNPGIMKGWHTFALLWTPDEYVFYVDGKERWRTSAGGVCQVPLYLKLSDELEFGGWAGDVRKANLPDEFLSDYVRVYDLVDPKTGERAWKPKPLR